MLAVDQPPVFHPTAQICSGPAFLCVVNVDSLVSTLLAVVTTAALGFWLAAKLADRRPGKFQMVFELLIDYTRGTIRTMVAEDAMFILPIALTIFFYILVANWLAVLPLPQPLLHPANSDFNQTLAMALVVILIVQWYSLRTLGLRGYLRRFSKPFDLHPIGRALYVPLNIIEEVAKPITLSLRLMGNIFGGLVMAWVLTSLLPQVPVPAWLGGSAIPTVLSVVLLGVWKAFDVFFIGAIQAFIFFLLTIVYFGMAREGLEEEHGHGATTTGHRETGAATAHPTTH